MPDLKLITELIVSHPTLPFEPTCTPIPWRQVPEPAGRLSFGILMTDGVVDPHPPIQRALLETADKLRAAGHEGMLMYRNFETEDTCYTHALSVLEFSPPFSLWEAALCTWSLYFQTGAAETKGFIKGAGELLSAVFSRYLKTFNIKALTVPELFKVSISVPVIRNYN
jgi:amidase